MSLRSITIAMPALALCLACQSREQAPADTSAPAGTPAATPAGTPAPAATAAPESTAKGGMAMHPDTVAQRVQGDLAAMDAASGDSIVRLVPAHRQTVEMLIADCEKMMREMKMTPPGKWTNAVKDVRTDLSKLASANAASAHALWPDHKKRIQDMLDMRRDMMKM